MADAMATQRFRSGSLLVVLVLCLQIDLSHQTLNTTVCNPANIPNSDTPKKPSLSETYKVKIECNMENQNYTTDFVEMYSEELNLAAAHQWYLDFHADYIVNAKTNELFSIETQTNQCVVSELDTSSNSFLFGYTPTGSNTGRLFTAYGALRFGNNANEQYMGKTVVRGITADEWKSCLYWKNIDATMEVHWYFSATTWQSATGRIQAPLRATVKGFANLPYPHPFNHTYEFNEYLTTLNPADYAKDFETPTGVVCPGRKDTVPLPTPSQYFVFTSETLQTDQRSIGFIKEWYDYQTGLVRYDYKPSATAEQPFGNDLLSEVHDFSEGISYVRDPKIGNCTLTAISGSGFDAEKVDANHVRIRTNKEFFYFDKASYAYEGVKQVRDMDCDVWVARRTDWPPGSTGVNSTWEWYFARQKWRESTGHTYVFGMPLRLNVIADIGHFVYNIYDFDEEQPQIWNFDISSCYNYTDKKDFTFKIPGSYQNIAGKNLEIFKYFVMIGVATVTGVSPLRIDQIQVDYDSSNILISLTLLGPVPKTGDVAVPATQINLQTAETKLTNAINSNQLKIQMSTTTVAQAITLTAQPYSLKSSSHVVKKGYYTGPSDTSTRYSGGAVAGLGVGMAVVFFVIGFLIVFAVYKKNGGTFSKSPQGGFAPQKFGEEHGME